MDMLVMKTLTITLLLTSTYGHPQYMRIQKNPLPTVVEQSSSVKNNVESQNSFEVTVKEVEDMLRANPKLPRLTRGEILDIVENLTKTETVNKDSFQPSNFVKNNIINHRDPKAVMKVLPFTPDSASESNVEDLYTKPPITQIIDHHPLGYQEGDNGDLFNYDVPKAQSNPAKEMKKHARPTKKYKGNQQLKTERTSTTSTSSTTTTTTPATPRYHPLDRKPQHFRRKLVRTTTTTTNPPAATRRYTTTTRRYSNHRYEDETPVESSTRSSSTLFPNHAIKIVKPPVLPAENINEDLLTVEDINKLPFAEKDVPVSFVPVKDIDLTVGDTKEEYEDVPFVVEIPEHLKAVLSELNLESALNTIPKKQKKTKPKSTPKPKTSVEEDDDYNNLLKTLELLAAQTSTTTTTTPLPDVSDVVDNLSPDMKDLLMNFGLIPNTNPSKPSSDSQIYESYNSEKAEVSPDSYIGFKPLPENDDIRDDMHELLARFGLENSARKQKSLETEGSAVNIIPNEYHNILEGDLESAASETSSKNQSSIPGDNIYATDEEIEKLHKLSSIVNQLENLNRTITDEDLKKIDTDSLKELIESLNKSYLNDVNKPLDEQDAPDPINDELIIKNEVKREESSSESSEEPSTKESDVENKKSTTSTTQTPRVETTTSEASQTPSIKDLEDSFGGAQTAENSSEEAPAPPPPEPETGFYYLLDWNTFLDIDDQKGRRVNLRFQPKVGNPMRFLSVSVP